MTFGVINFNALYEKHNFHEFWQIYWYTDLLLEYTNNKPPQPTK
jgi:hypothetical protein